MKVLVVDDSKTSRFLIRKALEPLSWDLQEAGHGLEALELVVAQKDFDVLFVDWNMPYMNGLELLLKVRAIEDLAQPRVLMVTTETELERVAEALERGADEYVMKPFTQEIILGKLALLGLEVE